MQTITLQNQTYEKLREVIMKAELYPAQKIAESHLMEPLHVGRIPILQSPCFFLPACRHSYGKLP